MGLPLTQILPETPVVLLEGINIVPITNESISLKISISISMYN